MLTKAEGDALKAALAADVDKYVQQPPTIANMTATPATLPFGGGQVTINATVTGADSMTLDGLAIPSLPTTVGVTANHAFQLVATNAAGSTSAQALVTVAVQPPIPTITNMTVTPNTLPVGGGPVVVNATVTNADTVTLSIDGGTPAPVTLPATVTLT
jgi:hypothetical protein